MSDSVSEDLVAFEDACQEVADVLLRCSGMEQWLVTRVTGSTWTVLASAGASFTLRRRSTVDFDETICAQMIAGGPRFVASVPEDTTLATTPLALRHGIGAYVGAVIRDADGTVFGTLVGIDTRRHPPVVDGLDRQVHLFASLLSARVAETRRAECLDRIVVADELCPDAIDPVTGLFTRDTWLAHRDRDERRSAILGDDALVAVVHIDGLDALRRGGHELIADEVLREASFALRSAVGPTGGRTDDTLMAVVSNRRVDLSGLRKQLGLVEHDGVVVQLATSWRRHGDVDGLAAAERRALARLRVGLSASPR